MEMVDTLIEKIIDWTDRAFNIAEGYFGKYGKWILGIITVAVVGKVLNIKLKWR